VSRVKHNYSTAPCCTKIAKYYGLLCVHSL